MLMLKILGSTRQQCLPLFVPLPPQISWSMWLQRATGLVFALKLCGTSLHRRHWTTSPQEWLPLGQLWPCASSLAWPLTCPVCAWWPWRGSRGDFSPAKQQVVIDVAETSALIFYSPTALSISPSSTQFQDQPWQTATRSIRSTLSAPCFVWIYFW